MNIQVANDMLDKIPIDVIARMLGPKSSLKKLATIMPTPDINGIIQKGMIAVITKVDEK
jgi:hypothetical protein